MSQASVSFSQRLTARLYKAVLWGLSCTHVKIVAILGLGIGILTWLIFAERRRIVARNLRIVIDPNLRPAQLKPLVRKNIMLTCMNFACALKVGIMTPKEMEKSIRLEGNDIFEEAGSEGRTGLACIPHAGNWEILARIRPLFTKIEHYGSMYRRMSNPALEEVVYNCRTKFGCEMFSKEKDIRGAIRLASKGGLLGILSDQYTFEGLFVPYFGKVIGTTPLPSLLKAKDKHGKLTAFSVFTRNTGLGKWDAVLGRTIEFTTNPINQMAADTISINQALERCLNENILDGFWMHHRWKTSATFAPKQPAGTAEVAAPHTRLPFRMLVAVPETMAEALCCIPAIRVLKKSRFDAQVIIICPQEQQAFWQQMEGIVTHVVTIDGEQSLDEQLNADTIYKEGPLDYLFMFSDNKKTLSVIKKQGILPASGFEENPLHRKFKYSYSSAHVGPAQHRSEDYLQFFTHLHSLAINRELDCAGLEGGNNRLKQTYIAPFSTLGEADSWPQENWQNLVRNIGDCKLLALEEHRTEAQQLAQELGLDCCICNYGTLKEFIGTNCQLISVDGALAQLATLYGCETSILMASRLPDRYGPWLSNGYALNKHCSCHPCYQDKCSAQVNCLSQISVEDVITAISKNES